jgi:Fem-1 family protein b
MYFRYPCWRTAYLLINCDANVDALDMDNNTSLHVLVQNRPLWQVDLLAIIDLLCNARAHLDVVNRKGQTPFESISSSEINIIQYLKKKMTVSRLKCLCARLIREQKFSVENVLSKSLLNFIQIH